MTRDTRRVKNFLPQGFSVEDLETTKWFLSVVATVYPGALHSHSTAIAVPDRYGRSGSTSLSALFHAQWPQVQLVDILTALARVGFITPPQKTAGLVANEESCGYSFRLTRDLGQLPPLVLRGGSARPRAGRKDRGAGQNLHRKVG